MGSIVVTNSDQLNSAIRNLQTNGGGTIEVVASDTPYVLTAYRLGAEADTIRIVAADADNPPDFNYIQLTECRNLSFEGLLFDSSSDPSRTGRDVNVYSSQNITFSDNTFVSRATGFFDPEDPSSDLGKNAAYIRDCDGFVFENNTVSNMYMGIAFNDCRDTQVTSNTFSELIGDGLRMSGMIDTLVAENTFGQTFGSTQVFNHSDFIQLWSTDRNTQNTENLTIRDNMFNSSGGASTQSIFLKNNDFPNSGQLFQNIVVENNTILNGHTHGVTIYDTEGVRVANNTLLWDQAAGMKTNGSSHAANHPPSIRLYNASDAVVENNITNGIYAPGDSNVIQNNAFLNYVDPSSPNYVGAHFVNATGAGVLDERDLALLPDSSWNGVYGATDGCLTNLDTPDQVTAVARQLASSEDPNVIVYDASQCLGVNPDTATYRWVFEDGTVLEGQTVEREYTADGMFAFTLEVTCAAGTDSIDRQTLIQDRALLIMEFDEGITDSSSYLSALTATASDHLVDGIDGDGTALYFDGSTKIRIDRSAEQLRALEAFSISASLKLDPDGNTGTVMHMHNGLEARVNADGSVTFGINAGGQWAWVATDPGMITADNWHRVAVVFNGTAPEGGLKLYVDGELAGTSAATAPLGTFIAPQSSYLNIGNTWGPSWQGAMDKLYINEGVMSDQMAKQDYLTAHNLDLPEEPEPPVSPLADADLLLMALDGDADPDNADPLVVNVLAGEDAFGDEGFRLSDTSRLQIDRSNAALHGIDTFTFAVTIRLDDAGSTGKIFDVHRGMFLEVTEGGGLKFVLNNGTTWAGATSGAGLLTGDGWHRIVVSYDGTDTGSGAAVYVDGVLAASADMSGGVSETYSKRYHLFIGDTWGNNSVDATVKDLALSGTALDADGVALDAAAFSWGVPDSAAIVDAVEPESQIQPDIDADSFLLDVDFTDGPVDMSAHASTMDASAGGLNADGVTGDGFRLDGGTRVWISRDNAQLRDLESFTINLSLQRDADGDDGVFLKMHKGMEASIDADGSLLFGMNTTDGWVWVRSAPGLLNDADWHSIHITLDGADDLLSLYLDGTAVAQTIATGSFVAPSGSHLYIGNIYGTSLQGTVDDIQIRNLAIDPHSISGEYAAMQQTLDDAAAVSAYADLFKMAIGEEQLVLEDGIPADMESGALLDAETSQETLASMDIDIREGFSLSFELKGDADGDGMAASTLARVPDVFEASITDDRALRVQITTDQGSFEAVSDPGAISDSAFQKLVIAYDGSADAGGLAAFVDGDLVAANIEAAGALAAGDGQAMEIGGALSPDVLISEYGLSAFSLGTSGPEDDQESSVLETSIA